MMPSNLTVKTSPAAATTCGGTLSVPANSVMLSGAAIPASGTCTLTLTVSSGTTGSYSNTIAAGAVSSNPGGGNTAAATATLTVSASKGGGGGGALDWLDVMFVIGVLLAGRRHVVRRQVSRGSVGRRSRVR
jgi:hypothetical protein